MVKLIFDNFCLFKMLAVGNQNGKVYLWDIDVDDPFQARLLTYVIVFCCVKTHCRKLD